MGPIAAAEQKITDNLPMIVDRMIELVNGVTVQETDSHGNARVYSLPPDREAGRYLMDRVMGKPLQRADVNLTGNVVKAIDAAAWEAV
jgi:hypothetical protein